MIQSSSMGSRNGEGTYLLSSQEHQHNNLCVKIWCCQRLPSKALLLILAWTVIIGEMYALIQVIIVTYISSFVPMGVDHFLNAISFPLAIISAILAAIAIFYPLSGFLADVWCGQFKVIIISLTIILLSVIIIATIIFIIRNNFIDSHHGLVLIMHKDRFSLYVIGFAAAFFVVIGYAAYQANFIQLGLDQLMEAPSTSLSVLYTGQYGLTHWEHL